MCWRCNLRARRLPAGVPAATVRMRSVAPLSRGTKDKCIGYGCAPLPHAAVRPALREQRSRRGRKGQSISKNESGCPCHAHCFRCATGCALLMRSSDDVLRCPRDFCRDNEELCIGDAPLMGEPRLEVRAARSSEPGIILKVPPHHKVPLGPSTEGGPRGTESTKRTERVGVEAQRSRPT
jgi:hypothetical protein